MWITALILLRHLGKFTATEEEGEGEEEEEEKEKKEEEQDEEERKEEEEAEGEEVGEEEVEEGGEDIAPIPWAQTGCRRRDEILYEGAKVTTTLQGKF